MAKKKWWVYIAKIIDLWYCHRFIFLSILQIHKNVNMEPILDQSDISNNFYLNSFRIIYKKKIDWMFKVLISYSVKYLFRFQCYLVILLPSALIGDLIFAIEQTTVNYLQKLWGIHYFISNKVSNILPSFMI